MPLVSIIIPVFKVGKYIENSIISVSNQRFKNFEVLLVDNNSPDDSIEIAERILKEKKVEYRVVSQTIQGLPAARNMGIAEAKGEWLVSIDPDDTISSYFLEDLYNCATLNNLDVVFSKYAEVSAHLFSFPEETNQNTIEIYTKEEILPQLLVRKMPLMVSNMFFRKEYFLKTGLHFDQSVILGADLILLWQLLMVTPKIAFINKYLYNHFCRPDSLMTAPTQIKVDTNLAGYLRLKDFAKDKVGNNFASWIYAREVYALLSTLAIFGDKTILKNNKEKYFTAEVYKNLQSFPDAKIQKLNEILNKSTTLFYLINKVFRSPHSLMWKLIAKRLHK